MPATIKNHMVVDRFKELLNEFYTEPQEEEILGSFQLFLRMMISMNNREPCQNKRKRRQ